MGRFRNFSCADKTLVSQWHVMLAMALALVKQILMLQRAQPRKAFYKAEMLEAWCVIALTCVAFQIDAQAKQGTPRRFDHQLPPIAVILQTLLLLVRCLKRGLLAGVKSWAIAETFIHEPALSATPARRIVILDPG